MIQNTSELKSKGMQCLVERLGIVDAEAFIALIIREQFDYTEWRREYYDQFQPGEFMEKAHQYAEAHPFEGKAKRIILD